MSAKAHHFAELGEVRLHYVTEGEGPTVLLLHGWPETWYMWRDVMAGLAAAGYRAVAPDLRGIGESSRPAGGYDKRTLAEDCWRLLTETLGESRCFVVGHDWGGAVAFALAAAHRSAVRRLAIFDIPVPGDGTPVMFNNRWHHGLHWEPGLAEDLTAGREDVYLRFFYRHFGMRPDAIEETAQQEYLRAYRQPGAMTAGFKLYRAMQQDVRDNQSILASHGKLPMPVLAWGGEGGRGRGTLALESWRRVATDVRGGVALGCGHWIPEERPAWTLAQILEFFAEDPEAPTIRP